MNEPEIVMYDDCFFVEERFGLWISTSKESEALVTSLTKEECCLLYTSPSPRDQRGSRMPSSA